MYREDSGFFKGLVIFVCVAPLALIMFMPVISYFQNAESSQKASYIFDKYVAIAKEQDGLSQVEKINLEFELKSLGYTNVEITVPEVDSIGDYPILVSVSKNYLGAKNNETVFKETIKIEKVFE